MAFLGDNLILWILLALGGALSIGNLLALVRPKKPSPNPRNKLRGEPGNEPGNEPEEQSQSPDDKLDNTDLQKAPLWRSVLMIILGTAVTIWALASLLSS